MQEQSGNIRVRSAQTPQALAAHAKVLGSGTERRQLGGTTHGFKRRGRLLGISALSSHKGRGRSLQLNADDKRRLVGIVLGQIEAARDLQKLDEL